MKRAVKGEAGYIRYERFIRLVRTLALFAIPFIAFLAATLYYGTNKNMISVIAMVGMLPACMMAVSLIMVYTIRPIDGKLLARIREHAGSLTMAYELYLTNGDKNTLLESAAVCGDQIVGLSTYKNPGRKDAEAHIMNTCRSAGFRAGAAILTDPEKYLERLDSLNAHAEQLRAGLTARPDPRYPEETYEEQLLHILLRASL